MMIISKAEGNPLFGRILFSIKTSALGVRALIAPKRANIVGYPLLTL